MTSTEGIIPSRAQQVVDAVEAGDTRVCDLSPTDYAAYASHPDAVFSDEDDVDDTLDRQYQDMRDFGFRAW